MIKNIMISDDATSNFVVSEFSGVSVPKFDFKGSDIFNSNDILLSNRNDKKSNDSVRVEFINECDLSEITALMKNRFTKKSNKFPGKKNISSSLLEEDEQGKNIKSKNQNSSCILTCKIGDLRVNKTVFPNIKNNKQSSEEDSLTVGLSTESCSTGYFLSNNRQEGDIQFVKEKDSFTTFCKPLRLFNKSGKPLTDRVGRPLNNIFGERLLILDDKGDVISDSKGNQVFNSLGESAIYPTTNLYIPPSEDEPGIPLLDIDKEHILFLYDNKGHPLTDSFGRPLLCASGAPMLGMSPKLKLDLINHEHYTLKKMYSRKPLGNFIRYVQILDLDAKPLTDDCGRLLDNATLTCNKYGMPICDCKGRPLYFKYGSRIASYKKNNQNIKKETGIKNSELKMLQSSAEFLTNQIVKYPMRSEQYIDRRNMTNLMLVCERCVSDGLIKYSNENSNSNSNAIDFIMTCETNLSQFNNEIETNETQDGHMDDIQVHMSNKYSNEKITNNILAYDIPVFPGEHYKSQESIKEQCVSSTPPNVTCNLTETDSKDKFKKQNKCSKESTETVFLFNATEKMRNQESSSVDVAHFEAIKEKQLKHKQKLPNKMYSLNLFKFFKGTFSKYNERKCLDHYQYNEYGKPLRDIRGNSLYDKYGIPLTGAHGRRLSGEARQALRLKLRNIPKNRANTAAEGTFFPISGSVSHDRFGEPVYDKYGRPLYDLAGRLIYDRFGRPMTDAFGRPLVDVIGQPLMDCEGRVLTSGYDSDSNIKLIDIFGRKIYDKRGRTLFDPYGRPKYDIFTNAIYDSCGRPATDANGKVLFDFLNKPIQPYPDKPLLKNARTHLPKYIDTILSVPSMYRVLKYSQPLEDVFGGPLFDDLGIPLYNKIGKPLFDRYGRPLYDKNGTPLCDCYGRPLSEDIKTSDDDQTLSVVDCLKLLKVTEESSKWMINKSKVSKSEKSKVQRNIMIKVTRRKKPKNKRFGQYVYSLTRVTKFASGRQALEILEAPLSPSTVAEMHRLPVDNKPLVMVVGQRNCRTVKLRAE